MSMLLESWPFQPQLGNNSVMYSSVASVIVESPAVALTMQGDLDM